MLATFPWSVTEPVSTVRGLVSVAFVTVSAVGAETIVMTGVVVVLVIVALPFAEVTEVTVHVPAGHCGQTRLVPAPQAPAVLGQKILSLVVFM